MGGIPRPTYHRHLVASGSPAAEVFSFELSDIRNLSQLKEDLKETQMKLAAANAEIKELREQYELEYNCRRMAKNKCVWLKEMLIRIIPNLGRLLREVKRGGGVDGDLKMLKGIPARLELLIARLEGVKVKEDFRGFGVELDEIMKSFRNLHTKREEDKDTEDNPRTVDEEEIQNAPAEPPVIPVPVSSTTELEEDVDVVSMGTVGEEQKLLLPKPVHAVNPKNRRQCLCRYTNNNPTNVHRHVWRLTRGRHTTIGSFVCPFCGDRLTARRALKTHLTCHKSPKARVDSKGSNEEVQFVGQVIKSGGQGTSIQVTKSGSGSAAATWPSPSVVISNTQEQQLMENEGDGQTEVAGPRSLRSTTASGIKHGISRRDSQQCLCGFRSQKVRQHVWRMTAGKHTITGSYICKICGDRFKRSFTLRSHLARHEPPPNAEFRKTISPVPAAESQTETEDNGCGEMPVLTQQCTPMPSPISQDVHQSNNGPNSTESPPKSAENHYEIPSSTGYRFACGETKCSSRDDKFKCPSCEECFPFKGHLKRHCVLVHNMIPPVLGPMLRCRLCQESFSTYSEFFNHQHAMHSDQSPCLDAAAHGQEDSTQ